MADGEIGRVVLDENFSSDGYFEYRTLFKNAPDRTDNWAVKTTDLPDGRLLMVWMSTSGDELAPSNRLWVSFSSDNGAGWSPPEVFAETTEEEHIANPCLYTHSDGTVFIFYNVMTGAGPSDRFIVCFQTSRDSGKTWSSRQKMDTGTDRIGLMSSAIHLRNGAILLPACYDRPKESREHYVGTVMLSQDGGKTWKRGGDFDVKARRGVMEPTVAQLRNGDLYALSRTRTGYQYECRSSDGGLTWTKPVQSPFASPEATGILWRLASGNLLFVWDNNDLSGGEQTPRYPLFVAMSEDDGKTWPYKKMIETTYGSKQLSNQGVFQTKTGMIIVPMNHHQRTVLSPERVEYGDIDLARFDEAWIRSGLSSDKWKEIPAPTGGIHLDSEGVLLVSGTQRMDQTALISRVPLPPRCLVEFEVTDIGQNPNTVHGFFVGGAPMEGAQYIYFARSYSDSGAPRRQIRYSAGREPEDTELSGGEYYSSTTVRIRFRDGKAQYEDSGGVKSEWVSVPWGPQWGFFARNGGRQGRFRIKKVRIVAE